MKTIRVVVTILFVFFIALFVGLFIFLKTVDLNRFKAQITGQISKSIGRDVEIKHVSFHFSVRRGVTLDISGLSVMDHPDFAVEPMLYIDSSHLDIDILPFLSKRQLLISKVEFNSLKINLIKNSLGEINFQKLTEQTKKETGNAKATVLTEAEGSSEKAEKKETKDFDFREALIRSIHITDGTFVFTDQTASPAMTIPVTQFEFEVTNVSFNAAFSFQGMASLWGKQQNISFKGLAQINAEDQQVRIDDLKVQTDLSDLVLELMYDGVPSMKAIGLKGGIKGELLMTVHQMILGKSGLLVLSSDGRLTDGKIQFKNAPFPIENLNIYVEATESDLEIKEMKMPLASGQIETTGRIIEYLTDQEFLANLNLKDIELTELGAQIDLPVKLAGQIYGDLKMSGKGLGKDDLETSLTGDGILSVQNGRVVDINILKLVLSKISFIPDLVTRIENNLPDKYKEKLKADDTILEKVEMDTKIHEGTLFINSAELNADGFLVIARGKLSFDQNLNLEADFYIPADLSKSMVASAQELSYFLDERKRIHIPFKPYNGKLEHFRMYPDIEDLGKEVIRNRGREELKKIIFKALDLDDEPSEENPPEDSQTPGQPSEGSAGEPQERELSPEEAIIENILDIIPIF